MTGKGKTYNRYLRAISKGPLLDLTPFNVSIKQIVTYSEYLNIYFIFIRNNRVIKREVSGTQFPTEITVTPVGKCNLTF